jgi:hypothetical protein
MDRIKQGNQRTEELNQRISDRNMPSKNLQPQFDIRPVSCKNIKMPILDRRTIDTVPIQNMSTYDIRTTFNPGSAQAPWSGFASNINDESRLRNQFFALQKGANQSYYIPAKNSDMYNVEIPLTDDQQPFPELFNKTKFDEFNPCPTGLGINFFENFTRQQIKEMS